MITYGRAGGHLNTGSVALQWKPLWFIIVFREKLKAEQKSSEMEKQAVESKLASFEIYGKDFEALAKEYSRLQQEIATKSWALKEFAI